MFLQVIFIKFGIYEILCIVNLLKFKNVWIAEYGAGAPVSTSGDVYSYGILLLEMFTGRRPTADMFKDGHNLHNFVGTAFPDRIMEIIDPGLLLQPQEDGDFKEKEEASLDSKTRLQECLASILLVGLSCTKESARERKNMRTVATELHAIKDAIIGVRVHGESGKFASQPH